MNIKSNNEIKKIFIVVAVLLVLLLGVFFIRWQRSRDLKKIADMQMQNSQVERQVQESTTNLQELPGKYYLQSQRTDFSINEVFEVEVMFEADGRIISGSDVYLTFDPDYLQADQDIKLGDFFLNYYRVEIDNENGFVKVTGFRTSEKEELNRPVNMMKVSFLTKRAGTTRIDFDFEPGKTNKTTIVEKGTGKNILGQAGELILTIK